MGKKRGGSMKAEALVTGEVYHVYSKSIAGYEIFNNDSEFMRMKKVMAYYQGERQAINFSRFKECSIEFIKRSLSKDIKKLVQIICYCIMPTHIHLVLKQLEENGISCFMGNVLNSYSRYFNIKHNRKGPLWEGRFKKVHVRSDEQLLHLTRYIHLNPPTAYLVNQPEDWKYSSYGEYIAGCNPEDCICDFDGILDIIPGSYKKFAEDRIAYQRELAKIRNLIFE
ncbi:transposase [Candidatus Omnitrophota bacterium]